ncbi:MobA/MobL family protein [Psychrobacter frigidicola]|uniref:MobA/MobL family protein n=1 Tax=Psychrobacter frigidicola TaxID=45611 RepID=UPI001917EF6F|nr:MobA/MobL family protein [Psychrobacter frigidicola]
MALGRLSVGVGRKGKAAPHAQYIAREGKYAKAPNDLEKLEFTGQGNMPLWAESEPNFFWQMSDEHERSNGSAYREHVIALPRELSIDERHDLVKEWIEQEVGDKHAYQYAIHNPPAMDGYDQPHCHLMFSERTIDNIDRDPDQYFKRYNSKNPERGGAKKANTGMHPKDRKAELKAQRDRWEQICNDHLIRAGSNSRINMKSYKDRGSSYKPLNMTMIQIQKPDVKAAYKEHLDAKRELFISRRQSRRMGISTELNNQQEKLAEEEKVELARVKAEELELEKARQAELVRVKAEEKAKIDAEHLLIAKAAQVYVDINKIEMSTGRSSWGMNSDEGVQPVSKPNATKALFSQRQLTIIGDVDDLWSNDSHIEVCEVLAKPEHADIVALLLDPSASRYRRQVLLPLHEMSFLDRNTKNTLEELHNYHRYITQYLDDDKPIEVDFFNKCKDFNGVLDTFNLQLQRETRFTYNYEKLDNFKIAYDESKKLFDNVFKELEDKGMKPHLLEKEQKEFLVSHDEVMHLMNSSRGSASRIADKKQDNKKQKPTYNPPRPR